MPETPLIIHGGQTIFPREVERVLLSHPGVAEAVVVGVPDRFAGEMVGAAVRLSPPSPCAAELTEFCRTRLAPGKVPVRWLFTGSVPLTADGTPDRATLTGQLAVTALDRPSWTAPAGRCGPARPLSATKDLRIPQQVRRSWALEDPDYL
jgi:fatty-acyl-CoA synthase